MRRVEDVVGNGKVKTVTLPVATQRRVVLEAVAFGSFLRDAEAFVDAEAWGAGAGFEKAQNSATTKISFETIPVALENLTYVRRDAANGVRVAAFTERSRATPLRVLGGTPNAKRRGPFGAGPNAPLAARAALAQQRRGRGGYSSPSDASDDRGALALSLGRAPGPREPSSDWRDVVDAPPTAWTAAARVTAAAAAAASAWRSASPLRAASAERPSIFSRAEANASAPSSVSSPSSPPPVFSSACESKNASASTTASCSSHPSSSPSSLSSSTSSARRSDRLR